MSEEAKFTQADVDRIVSERLATARQKSDAKVAELTEQIATARAEVEKYKPGHEEATTLRAELAKRDRSSLFTKAGIADEAVQQRVTRWFDAQEYEDGKRPEFAAWLAEEAPKDEIIGHLFAKPATTTTQAQQPTTRTPGSGADAKPLPAAAVKLTKAERDTQHVARLAAAGTDPAKLAEVRQWFASTPVAP